MVDGRIAPAENERPQKISTLLESGVFLIKLLLQLQRAVIDTNLGGIHR